MRDIDYNPNKIRDMICSFAASRGIIQGAWLASSVSVALSFKASFAELLATADDRQ